MACVVLAASGVLEGPIALQMHQSRQRIFAVGSWLPVRLGVRS